MVITMGESKGYIKTSDDKGSISICQDVVAVIAAAAAMDVDGVHGLYQSPGRELTTVSGKKGLSRGIRIHIENDNITADVYLIAEMNYPISEIGTKVQQAVMSAIEEAVGKRVMTVNIHISGVSLKKAKQEA
jgi:uncharacterized alkaline shock family protein YloU